VDSFDLQYVLVGVIAFCENVFVPGKSSVKVQPELVDIFLGEGELHIAYMDREALFSSC
jgi:hypothetical protein